MPTYAAQVAAGNCTIIWVCQRCMLIHANGECCAEDHEHEPLSDIPTTADLSMGLSNEDHAEDCGEQECECERRSFDTSACEGCGSPLHGERFAMFLVYDVREGVTP